MPTKKLSARKDVIDFTDVYQTGKWIQKWKVSRQQLFGAYRATGNNQVKDLRNYLRMKGLL